jgi:GNAT superfamily N-acetyltransferase
MNIRIATREDIPDLVEFNQAMAAETEELLLDSRTLEKGVRAVFDDDKKGFYVVAEETGRIVGGLMVTYEWSDWRNAWFWWIQSVYVRPEARGRKVYSRLYEFVRSKAEAAGDVCGYRLYVESDNESAQRVYEAVGMKRSHYIMFES